MKKSKLSILILVVSIISVYFNFNIISAEDTVDSSIINEDTINNMTIEDINSSNVNLEDKPKLQYQFVHFLSFLPKYQNLT